MAKRRILGFGVLAVSCAALLSCGGPASSNDSAAGERRTYEMLDTARISVAGVERLTVRFGDVPSLVISEAKGRFDKIEVDSSDARLRIEADDGFWFANRDYSVLVTVSRMDHLEVAGATDSDVIDFASDNVKIELAGAHDFTINGSCTALDLDVAGASDISAGDLVCATVSVDTAGASDVVVHATQALKVDSAGATNVTYYGAPSDVSRSIAGVGSVKAAKKSS